MDQIIDEVVNEFKTLVAKQALANVSIAYDAAHLDKEYDTICEIDPTVVLTILVHQPIFKKENILNVFSEKKLTVTKLFNHDENGCVDVIGVIDVIANYIDQFDGQTLVEQWIVRPILTDQGLAILN